LSPDGRRAVTGSDHTVRVWDLDTGDCLHALSGHTGRIGSVSLSPDGDLAVSSDDRVVRLWDVASGACVHVLRDLPDAPLTVRFVGDGRFVMSDSRTGTVRIWDPRTGRCLHTFTTGHGEVAITPAPDGRFALTSGGGAPLRLWEFDWDLATSST
jgi:WD40 repeat protein